MQGDNATNTQRATGSEKECGELKQTGKPILNRKRWIKLYFSSNDWGGV